MRMIKILQINYYAMKNKCCLEYLDLSLKALKAMINNYNTVWREYFKHIKMLLNVLDKSYKFNMILKIYNISTKNRKYPILKQTWQINKF